MTKRDVVNLILADRIPVAKAQGTAFAPVNIALCKYWGKRDGELNLPVTSSLSISLQPLGTTTTVRVNPSADRIIVNDNELGRPYGDFYNRTISYLDLFRSQQFPFFTVETMNNISTAAGLASSASGFAAFASALDDLFSWGLGGQALSVLARLGSGSACRSVYTGFVQWNKGSDANGMDSFAVPLDELWPNLCIGILEISDKEKQLSSRDAMNRTTATSDLYMVWPAKVENDLESLRIAISERNFELFGSVSESNALSMHATMIGAWPPVLYWLPGTIESMTRIWELREGGLPLYITMDAGPNIKILFLHQDIDKVQLEFPGLRIISPFSRNSEISE